MQSSMIPAISLLLLAGLSSAAQDPGLSVRSWVGRWDALPDFGAIGQPVHRGVSPGFTLDLAPRAEDYALLFTGSVRLPATGAWTFSIGSDDGARLYIDGRLVVDNDGLHDAAMRSGQPIELDAGVHPIRLEFFQASGGSALHVAWQVPGGSEPERLPDEALIHDPAAAE